MAYDKNVSPVGWYVGSYLLRFVELIDSNNDDPERRFLSWENTVLVKANSMATAFTKIEKIAKSFTKPYKGGPRGIPVRWVYVGITQILPIYEEISDGAEIAWMERRATKLKTLKKLVLPNSPSPVGKMRPNPSIERTCPGKPGHASHVKR